VKAFAIFAVATAAIVAASGSLLALAYRGGAERHAIVVSAWVAFGVQLFAFAIARLTLRSNVVAGWGLGALLRMAALAVYAFLVVNALGLVSGAALISLATFFFLTTLIEPLLLKV
jgi:hypothetical protein